MTDLSPSLSVLPNGLRVVHGRYGPKGLASVSVHYGVGFRSEPEGRSGFAHLFEHLMFQGSTSISPSQHFSTIQGSGGTANASTRQDYTEYYQSAPESALERMLFLESDRMAAPKFVEQNLGTQLAVVKEEVRRNVLDRPFGGFPWTELPGTMYRKFANAHNGYGVFEDLERATVEDCAAFFDAYYTPSNAVLTVVADLPEEHVTRLVTRHFGALPARPAAAAPALPEPPPGSTRLRRVADARTTAHATALGFRLPSFRTDPLGYAAHVVLAGLLTGDSPGGLAEAAGAHRLPVASVKVQCGFFAPFDALDPDSLVVTLHHDGQDPRRLAAFVQRELASLATDGPRPDRLARAVRLLRLGWTRRHAEPLRQARALGAFTLLHGRPDLVAEVPALLARVDHAEAATAAGRLVCQDPAALTVGPLPQGDPA
ncbi:M16 family metallopeptidase [Streptomyces sp. NPDC017966]|uniref:M16 family metallopeptidase n=1 Tax=Streptomyces sp. NPDC017966 TaxID=3365023 RepID=UPI0037A19662